MKLFKSIVVALSISILGGLVSGCAGTATASGSKNPAIVNVYNWGDYIDMDILQDFENETGIRVVYDTFASNEDMYTKIKSGGADYDIAIPSDYMIEKMIKEDLVEKIDFNNVPDFSNVDARFVKMPYDATGEYSVPYMWGTVGILYNTTMVDDPVDSWDILWDPKYEGQIFMYDSQRDSIGITLKRLGFSVNTRELAELLAAKEALIEQKPLVQAYFGDNVKDKMIGAEGALAVVYSGDAVYCIEENPDLAYNVPNEGSNIWFDAMVIPKGAKHKAEAEAFMNYLCKPEVAAKNTEYIGYSTVNKEALALLPPEMSTDPVYWPSEEIYEDCEVFLDLGDFIKEYDKAWTEILAYAP